MKLRTRKFINIDINKTDINNTLEYNKKNNVKKYIKEKKKTKKKEIKKNIYIKENVKIPFLHSSEMEEMMNKLINKTKERYIMYLNTIDFSNMRDIEGNIYEFLYFSKIQYNKEAALELSTKIDMQLYKTL
jgi:hypothetical protein